MSTFYSFVYVDPSLNFYNIIGRYGRHLKRCVRTTGVDSVWLNSRSEPPRIEIYGPRHRLEDARVYMTTHLKNIWKDQAKLTNFELTNLEADRCVSIPLGGLLDKDLVKLLIGRKGHCFKQITRDTRVSFIWYDFDLNQIRIWGQSQTVEHAVVMILTRVSELNIRYTHINDFNKKILNRTETAEETPLNTDIKYC